MQEYKWVSNTLRVWEAVGVVLMCSVVTAYAWQKSGKAITLTRWLLIIIIFYVAYGISTYGFAKLLKTQFQTPQFIKDAKAKELNGFWLTWLYYGYSQTLAFIIGATQVIGSFLLLFRKTRLAGVFILIPVMVNIWLINHFYEISPLAYFNSLHYTFILLFLLCLDYDKLVLLFSYPEKISVNRKSILMNVLRVAVIGGAFLNIYSLRSGVAPITKLNGAWKVQSIAKNNIISLPTDYQDSLWTRAYFEWRYGCLFKYNANQMEDKDMYGDYIVNENRHSLTASFQNDTNGTDSAQFQYRFLNDSTLDLSGKYKHDSLAMQLTRLK